MPTRPLSREQTWLLPPRLDELVPADHPARFVAAFIETFDRAAWGELRIDPAGAVRGAPGYSPRALLAVWLYGFMSGVRSSRKLEAACREQLPYLWLTGWQHPDHNTLWRFYQEHRQALRGLLKRTVRTAVAAGLVDLAVQAVDGTKLAGNAARTRTYDGAGLAKLAERTEAAIADLEAQNRGGEAPPPPRLPRALRKLRRLRERVQEAAATVRAQEAGGPSTPPADAPAGGPRVNLTDGEAVLVKTRQGYAAGYNGQAVAAALAPGVAGQTGRLIVAAAVVAQAHDSDQLLPMLGAAQAVLGTEVGLTLADGGYHSGPNLAACAAAGLAVLLPEAQRQRLARPHHKDDFRYDAAADTLTCGQGQVLTFRGTRRRKHEAGVRVYRGRAATCRACPLFGTCTRNRRHGRIIEVGPEEAVLRRHRARMATEAAQAVYRRRKTLIEPVFGILKEQQGARRLLLRGLHQVQAEWSLLATAFNLRTLARLWRQWAPERRGPLAGVAAR